MQLNEKQVKKKIQKIQTELICLRIRNIIDYWHKVSFIYNIILWSQHTHPPNFGMLTYTLSYQWKEQNKVDIKYTHKFLKKKKEKGSTQQEC